MEPLELIGGSPRIHARVAGVVGLLVLGSGSFAGYVASTVVVRGDAEATSRNLAASEPLVRFGLLASLVMMVAFLLYALLLSRLFAPASRGLATTMLAFVCVSVPIFMINQVNQYAALRLASEGSHGEVTLFLEMYGLGNVIAGIFFGLWLLPLGLLVLASGFVPRPLGVLLVAGTPGYIVLFVQVLFFPGSERTLWSNPLLVVTHLSELALLGWLLVKGVDVRRWEERARAGDQRPYTVSRSSTSSVRT